MIRKFLRLFEDFRNIEASNQKHYEERSGLLKQVDNLNVQLAQVGNEQSSLWKLTREAQAERDTAQEGYLREQQERIRTQDRLDSAIQDREQLWGLVKESLAGERFALQTQVNHANQKTGAGIVYPDAHSLPMHAVPKQQESGPVGRAGRMMPSQAAAQATTRALEEYAASQYKP